MMAFSLFRVMMWRYRFGITSETELIKESKPNFKYWRDCLAVFCIIILMRLPIRANAKDLFQIAAPYIIYKEGNSQRRGRLRVIIANCPLSIINWLNNPNFQLAFCPFPSSFIVENMNEVWLVNSREEKVIIESKYYFL